MTIEVRIPERHVVRVYGPARLRVLEGSLIILGARYSAGEEVELPRYRSYSLLAEDGARVEAELSGGGGIEEPVEGEEVVAEWLSAADRLASTESVMVVGPTDAGKTSLTITLINRGLAAGRRVGVIDADVGQADVGPPGFVSAAMVDGKLVTLRRLRARYSRFIGSITPSRLEERVVGAIVDLYWRLKSTEGAGLVVIDTDGWTSTLQALEYKANACRLIDCSAAVCVGCRDELAEVFRRVFSFTETLILPSPAVRRERSHAERRELRREAYARYLEGAVERVVGLGEVRILGSCLFSGRMLSGSEVEELSRMLDVRVIAASETMDSLYIYYDGGEPRREDIAAVSARYGGKHVYLYRRGCEENTLSAIPVEPGLDVIAILRGIDFSKGEARLLTSYQGEIKTIILGLVRLTENLEEAGRASKCML
ncbi:MAG: hypothetical protein GXO09_05415 [Crenarchaeota archaeon]|nr:hypothetical protein [Thermoproteota archaeon]